MKKSDFFFELPQELIAQTPCPRRDGSRMLVLDKKTGEKRHMHFCELPGLLRPGDCLVLNDSRVIPARLLGTFSQSGAPVELVLLTQRGEVWETLARPGRKCRPGTRLTFGAGLLEAVVEDETAGGNRLVRFSHGGIFNELLDKLGQMPLPPYIKERLEDPERYQTVYSRVSGSAAAPTAGLHFTKELLGEIEAAGITVAYLTLHVGLGTFRPVKAEDISEHVMHSEYYEIPEATANAVNRTRRSGGRVVAVGTTSCRTLETAGAGGELVPSSGWTDIFIYPGYKFRITDALLTNFHLPESTLIMLVSALAGRENVLEAYADAVRERYRFFSFGDCMLII